MSRLTVSLLTVVLLLQIAILAQRSLAPTAQAAPAVTYDMLSVPLAENETVTAALGALNGRARQGWRLVHFQLVPGTRSASPRVFMIIQRP
jgi:hypothetical protein